METPTNEFLNDLVGLLIDEAKLECINNGFTFRTTKKDGNNYMITSDMKFNRVNFEIENNTVVKATAG